MDVLYRCGDANGDGTVDTVDVDFLRHLLVSGTDATEKANGSDANGDGVINVKDLVLLRRSLDEASAEAYLPADLQGYNIISFEKSESGVTCISFCYGESVLGRSLVCWSIQQEEYDKTVLLNFAIHGWEDEYAADGQVLADLGNALVEYYAACDNLQGCRLLIVPCANPDGIAEGTTNNGFGRCNAEGVDLNRDFDANHVVTTTARNYTLEPFSAPESCALRDLALASNPDVVIDFHGWLNYTIGDAGLAEVFSLNVGLNHYKKLTSSAHGYFSYWAQLQGAEALLVEFTNSGSVNKESVMAAVDQILAGDYGDTASQYVSDEKFENLAPIQCYALTADKIYTQCAVGNSGTAYGYIDGANDLCTIQQIYDNGWCKVHYPVGTLVKTGFCLVSEFVDTDHLVDFYKAMTDETATVYTTKEGTTKLGSVWNTDIFTVVAEDEDMVQIIFPLDTGGYKMGWIAKSEIAQTIN